MQESGQPLPQAPAQQAMAEGGSPHRCCSRSERGRRTGHKWFPDRRVRIDREGLNEVVDQVVFVMGHEVGHHIEYQKKNYNGADEEHCDNLGKKCKKAFLAKKEELLAVWWAGTEKNNGPKS